MIAPFGLGGKFKVEIHVCFNLGFGWCPKQKVEDQLINVIEPAHIKGCVNGFYVGSS